MMTLLLGLLAGAVPVLLIILLPRRLLLPGWGLMALSAIGFALWTMRGLIQCRNDACTVLHPALLGLCAGLIVATLIGGIRWLASRGKRPW
jgi:hypothetical protein